MRANHILNNDNMTRKEIIVATCLLVLFGTGMHFVHHLPFFNRFWGCIFPVKESVMAHMKMVFYPMFLLGLYLAVTRRDVSAVGAALLGGLAVMPLIVAAFFAYWVFVRRELMAVDIAIYILAMAGAVRLAGRWLMSPFVRRGRWLWVAAAVLGMGLIGVLTYHAPDWIIFTDFG